MENAYEQRPTARRSKKWPEGEQALEWRVTDCRSVPNLPMIPITEYNRVRLGRLSTRTSLGNGGATCRRSSKMRSPPGLSC